MIRASVARSTPHRNVSMGHVRTISIQDTPTVNELPSPVRNSGTGTASLASAASTHTQDSVDDMGVTVTPSVTPAPPQPSIHDYTRMEKIATGSFGVVERVIAKNSKVFALKTINVPRQDFVRKSKLALAEIRLTSAVNHPYIVQYIEAFADDRNVHIVFEFCSGGDLKTKLDSELNSGSRMLWAESTVLKYFVQICLAIKHLHDKDILHRDIKTSNIFLTADGNVKLGDFGLARILKKNFYASRPAGTPQYVPPEMIGSKIAYDMKSDIWSLGVLLYEICSGGMMPFSNADGRPMLEHRIQFSEPAPISTVYSAELRFLISQMLSKRPEDRPTIDGIIGSSLMQEAFRAQLTDADRNKFRPGSWEYVSVSGVKEEWARRERGSRHHDVVERHLQGLDNTSFPDTSASTTTYVSASASPAITYQYGASSPYTTGGASPYTSMPSPITYASAAPGAAYAAGHRVYSGGGWGGGGFPAQRAGAGQVVYYR